MDEDWKDGEDCFNGEDVDEFNYHDDVVDNGDDYNIPEVKKIDKTNPVNAKKTLIFQRQEPEVRRKQDREQGDRVIKALSRK